MYNDNFVMPEKTVLMGGEEYDVITPDYYTLKLRREELGISQKTVADTAVVPLTIYQRMESGETSLSAVGDNALLGICKALLLDPRRFTPYFYTAP